jgi:hypothetical protein
MIILTVHIFSMLSYNFPSQYDQPPIFSLPHANFLLFDHEVINLSDSLAGMSITKIKVSN